MRVQPDCPCLRKTRPELEPSRFVGLPIFSAREILSDIY